MLWSDEQLGLADIAKTIGPIENVLEKETEGVARAVTAAA